MSRPLRIEYPGAWYHVMNRGRRGEDIFRQADDYNLFLQVIHEACKLFNLEVSAYCLMTNHYHLLVRTPDGNLSRCMRHINGVYTQRFNRKHDYDGQLFRGRFKAVLIEQDSHLLEVLRYIHRNPLSAKICQALDQYPWSSHSGYCSSAKRWEWLNKTPLLEMLSTKQGKGKGAYLDFVSKGIPGEIAVFYDKKHLSSLLGGDSFKQWVRDAFDHLSGRPEVAEQQQFSIPAETIVKVVCRHYNVPEDALHSSRRGSENQARNVAVYLTRCYSRLTLKQIGILFGTKNYSTVASIVHRVRLQIKSDKGLKGTVDKLAKAIKMGEMSQVKT